MTTTGPGEGTGDRGVRAVLEELAVWLTTGADHLLPREVGRQVLLPSGTEVTVTELRAAEVEVASWSSDRTRSADWRHERVSCEVHLGPTADDSSGTRPAVLAAQVTARDTLDDPPVTITGGLSGWFALGDVDAVGTPRLQVVALGPGAVLPAWVEAALPGLIADGSWDLAAARAHLCPAARGTGLSADARVAVAAHLLDRDDLLTHPDDDVWRIEQAVDAWLDDLRAGRLADAEASVTRDDPDRHARWLAIVAAALNENRDAAPRVVVSPWRGWDEDVLAATARACLRAELDHPHGPALFVLPAEVARAATRVHPARGWGHSRSDAHVDAFDLGPAHRCDTLEVYQQALAEFTDTGRRGRDVEGYGDPPVGAAAAARALTTARAAAGCSFGQKSYRPPVPMRTLWRIGHTLRDRLQPGATLGLQLPVYRDRRGRLHGDPACVARSYRPAIEAVVEVDADTVAHLCAKCRWQLPASDPLVDVLDRVLDAELAVLRVPSPVEELEAGPDEQLEGVLTGAEEPDGADDLEVEDRAEGFVDYDTWLRRRELADVVERAARAEAAVAGLTVDWPALADGFAVDLDEVREAGSRALTALAADLTADDVQFAAAAAVLGKESRPAVEPARLSGGIRLTPTVSADRVDAYAETAWRRWTDIVAAGYGRVSSELGWGLREVFGRARTGQDAVAARLRDWERAWAAAAERRASEHSALGLRTVLLALPEPPDRSPRAYPGSRDEDTTPELGPAAAATLAHFTVARSAHAALVRVPYVLAQAVQTTEFWPLDSADVPDPVTDAQAQHLLETWRPGLWPPALLHPVTARGAATTAPAAAAALPLPTATLLGAGGGPGVVTGPVSLRLGALNDLAGLPWPPASTVRGYLGPDGVRGTVHGQPRCARFRAHTATDIPTAELATVTLCPRCTFLVPVLSPQRSRASRPWRTC